jgi:alanyl-tRNA synthetase
MNLLFIQYDLDASGKLTPLPMKHVDTGTGLERVAAVLQSFETGRLLGNYDIDVFQKIIRKIEQAADKLGSKARYGQNAQADISFRAIADHIRAVSFLIAEGLHPGNAEREYVLRRLIRRAARHGRYLGIHEPFLAMVCEGVADAMGDAYPELRKEHGMIEGLTHLEERRFGETLDRGLRFVEEWVFVKLGGTGRVGTRNRADEARKLRGSVLPGDVAFRLYDTYGFPLDLTQGELRDYGIEVDVEGFERLMEAQRERGRAARRDEAVAPEIALGAGVSSRFVARRTRLQSSRV